ncbi:MAG: hypothetical protein ACOVN0_20230 [Niveispirillum sp.]|uniref:hypothetical protein n=1 Tax=Niveispirillum sp. TaxID=1917217 RepID=UPI003BA71F30
MSAYGLNDKKFVPAFRSWFERAESSGIENCHVESGDYSIHTVGIRDVILNVIDSGDCCVGCSPYFYPGVIRSRIENKDKFSIVSSWEEKGKVTPKFKGKFPGNLIVQLRDPGYRFDLKDPDCGCGIEYIRKETIDKDSGNGEWHARLHAKFLVSLKLDNGVFTPIKAIIGSYNFNDNPEYGLECIVVTEDRKIMDGLLEYWRQIVIFSIHERNKDLVDTSVYEKFVEERERDFFAGEFEVGCNPFADPDSYV